jgi:hypothetical protein
VYLHHRLILTYFSLSLPSHSHFPRSLSLSLPSLTLTLTSLTSHSSLMPQERFYKIVAETSSLFQKIGYSREKVTFVPISGRLGDNSIERSVNLSSWYSGPSLVSPTPPINDPLRVAIRNAYTIKDVGTMPRERQTRHASRLLTIQRPRAGERNPRAQASG